MRNVEKSVERRAKEGEEERRVHGEEKLKGEGRRSTEWTEQRGEALCFIYTLVVEIRYVTVTERSTLWLVVDLRKKVSSMELAHETYMFVYPKNIDGAYYGVHSCHGLTRPEEVDKVVGQVPLKQ